MVISSGTRRALFVSFHSAVVPGTFPTGLCHCGTKGLGNCGSEQTLGEGLLSLSFVAWVRYLAHVGTLSFFFFFFSHGVFHGFSGELKEQRHNNGIIYSFFFFLKGGVGGGFCLVLGSFLHFRGKFEGLSRDEGFQDDFEGFNVFFWQPGAVQESRRNISSWKLQIDHHHH